MDAPETVTEAVRLLESRGYRGGVDVVSGTVAFRACGHEHRPADLVVTETFRFEGMTDPADEAIVLGVECARCGEKAIVVSAFGPDADQELLELVEALDR